MLSATLCSAYRKPFLKGHCPTVFTTADGGFGGQVFGTDAGQEAACALKLSFHLDVGGFYDSSPLRELVGEHLAELGR
jgi:hypothetical protein